jgi:molybdopterin converting factor small subunit
MQIELELFGTLRDKVKDRLPGGRGAIELPEGSTIEQLAGELQIAIVPNCVVMVNGQMERDRNRKLEAGAKVTLIPPVAGGEKGDRNLLPERPEGCFAQKVPVPFFSGG